MVVAAVVLVVHIFVVLSQSPKITSHSVSLLVFNCIATSYMVRASTGTKKYTRFAEVPKLLRRRAASLRRYIIAFHDPLLVV